MLRWNCLMLLFLVLLAGCDSSTEPEGVEAFRYWLVEGPSAEQLADIKCDGETFAEVWLFADEPGDTQGRFVWGLTVGDVCESDSSEALWDAASGTWTSDSEFQSLTLTPSETDALVPMENVIASRTEDELIVEIPIGTFTFERIPVTATLLGSFRQ
jgi:hypothetical protein